MRTLDQNFWKKYFKVYDLLNNVIPYKELMEKVISKLEANSEDVILDAGSGTGNLSLHLKRIGARVQSLDNEPEAVKIHHHKDPKAEVTITSLLNPLPFLENTFNKIVCVNVLYNIPVDKRLCLTGEFYRILKPGGRIVIVNPSKRFNIRVFVFKTLKAHYKVDGIKSISKMFALIGQYLRLVLFNYYISSVSGQKNFFSIAEQEEVLKQAGFVEIKTELVYLDQSYMTYAIK